MIRQVRELAAERGLRHRGRHLRPPSGRGRAPGVGAASCSPTSTRSSSCSASTGVDYTLVVHFDEARSEGVRRGLRHARCWSAALDAQAVVVGDDFHFGHRRRGNVALLQRMGAELRLRRGRPATWSAPTAGRRGRGRRCRPPPSAAALAAGDLAAATALLGRPHEVRGVVQRGDERGRDARLPDRQRGRARRDLPARRRDLRRVVPAARRQSARPAALSLGRRPTFYEDAETSLLEAHLLDFDDDLYGEPARVRFVARLREERKFDSVDALVAQMGRDCDERPQPGSLEPGTVPPR